MGTNLHVTDHNYCLSNSFKDIYSHSSLPFFSLSSFQNSDPRGGEAQVCERSEALWEEEPTRPTQFRAHCGFRGDGTFSHRPKWNHRSAEGQTQTLHLAGKRGGNGPTASAWVIWENACRGLAGVHDCSQAQNSKRDKQQSPLQLDGLQPPLALTPQQLLEKTKKKSIVLDLL